MDTAHPLHTAPAMRLALVAMPWHLYTRPSIQLGALKAFLEREERAISVTAMHPYLEVAHALGGEAYRAICQNVWASEALYAGLLFEEQRDAARNTIKQALPRNAFPARLDVDRIRDILERQVNRFVDGHDWRQYSLVGFSVCFNQLLASLLAARQIKARHPDLPIVLGGSTCAPEVGKTLLKAFPQIDYVISGEGEGALLALCRHLSGGHEQPGHQVQARGKSLPAAGGQETSAGQIDDLADLHVPDYSDYFDQLRKIFTQEPFIPELPVEFSRGCWWRKCAFCNLNLQWRGYRGKPAAQMLAEVFNLSEQHGCLDFCFTDNALPVKDARGFFEGISASGRDLRFFAEVRVRLDRAELLAYSRGGLATVQAGIEALSDSLLKKMRKGATVVDNIAMMKNCAAAGIILEGNLIIEFPGSTLEEVEETVLHLDYALPFQPLSTAVFFLGLGSPVDCDPGSYGIKAVTGHPGYRRLFPELIARDLVLPIKAFRADRVRQRKLWAPVRKKVKEWQEFHRTRRGAGTRKSPLSYRDGGGYIVVRQELVGGRVLHHRLRGLSRQIYCHCHEPRGLDSLVQRFPRAKSMQLDRFLADLAAKRLLFAHGGKYLALAVREGPGADPALSGQ